MLLSIGNTENAKIYAENSIRKRTEATNFLRMAARVDGVASRVKSAAAMNHVLKNMGSVVKNLDKAINAMDLQKVCEQSHRLNQSGVRKLNRPPHSLSLMTHI